MLREQEFRTLYNTLCEGFSMSDDVQCRDMNRQGLPLRLLYIKSICDEKSIVKNLFHPYWLAGSAREFEQYLQAFPGCDVHCDLPGTIGKILQGYAVVFFEQGIYLLEAQNSQESGVQHASVETVVQGPNDAFIENLATNLNLIRTRYAVDSLRIETNRIGKLSKTEVAIIYDNHLVDSNALKKVRERLSEVQVDLLQSVGQLTNEISEHKWSLFPTVVITERPDRTVLNLSKGRIIIALDKSPFVAIVPSILSDFFASMDDRYQLRIVGRFLLSLRYIGFFLAISMPALYVATVSFNPEVYRVQLAFSIASSRAAVPYPSLLEVIFMMLMLEFLTEASIRLPKSIGQTATTVGGLILGQAATEAGLVSNIMIIITSVVALSNFVIPINEMAFAVRTHKYMLLVAASCFGLVGYFAGLVGMIYYLASLDSFGTPYIKLFRKGQQTDGS
jgi:spore germination protein KA